VCTLVSCGGGAGNPNTCVAIAVTYGGSQSGAAYLKVTFADGAIYGNAPSIQLMMLAENGATHCSQRGPGDVPYAAVAWIDASSASATSCADTSSAECQAASTDPQAHQSGIERYGATTQVHLDLVDPP
jgi:hypothetical protein